MVNILVKNAKDFQMLKIVGRINIRTKFLSEIKLVRNFLMLMYLI